MLDQDLPLLVLIKGTHHISNVESLALVAEELRDVLIVGHLVTVELFAALIVNQVFLVLQNEPAMLTDPSTSLVDAESLPGAQDVQSVSFCEIEVSHDEVRVEVVPLPAEGRWQLPCVIQSRSLKHFLEILVLNNAAALLVEQVAAGVCDIASFVSVLP